LSSHIPNQASKNKNKLVWRQTVQCNKREWERTRRKTFKCREASVSGKSELSYPIGTLLFFWLFDVSLSFSQSCLLFLCFSVSMKDCPEKVFIENYKKCSSNLTDVFLKNSFCSMQMLLLLLTVHSSIILFVRLQLSFQLDNCFFERFNFFSETDSIILSADFILVISFHFPQEVFFLLCKLVGKKIIVGLVSGQH